MAEKMSSNKIKLNLGCGDHCLEGYVNVDLYSAKADISDDITDLRHVYARFGAGNADEIYSAHSLMCVPEGKMMDTLLAWKGLLREGGRLVVETTDLDRQIGEYVRDVRNARKVVRSLFGNGVRDGLGIRYQFNFDLLKMWLERAGFRDIKKISQPNHSRHNQEFNLAVEAIK